jgi:hypothetical protein
VKTTVLVIELLATVVQDFEIEYSAEITGSVDRIARNACGFVRVTAQGLESITFAGRVETDNWLKFKKNCLSRGVHFANSVHKL